MPFLPLAVTLIALAGAPADSASAVAAVTPPLEAAAGRASVAAPAVDDTARIVYRSGDLIYVGAGRTDGLTEGQILRVERDGAAVGSLKVEHLASRRASCSIVEAGEGFLDGDVVRFDPRFAGDGPVEVVPAPRRSPRRDAGGLRGLGFRGRIGGRYFSIRDRAAGGAGISQPALDVRFIGREIGGSPFGVVVDARARRIYRTMSDGDTREDGRTRVYRMSASYEPPESPLRLVAGRQVSPDLASVSLFDGLLAELVRSRMTFGAFAGTEPDEATFGFSTRTLDVGAFARYDTPREGARFWTAAGGVVVSTVEGETNRDYLFLRGQLTSARLHGYVTQEIDLNRGWKTDVGEPALAPTSLHASVYWQATSILALDAGFDNRRNLRLYRDRITPETEFDDSYRQGISGGLTLTPRDYLRFGGSVRVNRGGSGGESEAYTATARVFRILPLDADVATRSTWYRSELSRGWIHVLTTSAPIGRDHRLGVHAGYRDEDRSLVETTRVATRWVGADLDLRLSGAWYLLGSGEITRGDAERNDQIYTSLTWRF